MINTTRLIEPSRVETRPDFYETGLEIFCDRLGEVAGVAESEKWHLEV